MPRILLIEDDAQHILLARIRLEARGFEVAAAQTGADGLAGALEFRPDLILLDLNLPDASVADMIAGLRGIPSARKTPIIAFTALDAFELHRRRLHSEIAEFIQKPYETTELLEKVTRVLGGPQKNNPGEGG